METREYTIQELSELSGVPRRTVHFYTQQGILPPPQGAGLGARYSDLHLLRLRAVPVLRARGLRLDEIRQRLSGLDLEATRGLLSAREEPPAPPAVAAAIREPQPAWTESPVSPGRSYLHYYLPGGLELAAPVDLDPEMRRRLLHLLQEAGRILAGQDE